MSVSFAIRVCSSFVRLARRGLALSSSLINVCRKLLYAFYWIVLHSLISFSVDISLLATCIDFMDTAIFEFNDTIAVLDC
jgi:DMSO/TMAO reductase YedYZ heme-binding membrane subunit